MPLSAGAEGGDPPVAEPVLEPRSQGASGSAGAIDRAAALGRFDRLVAQEHGAAIPGQCFGDAGARLAAQLETLGDQATRFGAADFRVGGSRHRDRGAYGTVPSQAPGDEEEAEEQGRRRVVARSLSGALDELRAFAAPRTRFAVIR